MRHRLARDDAVALTARRYDDDRRTLVARAELRRRHEADRLREERAQRAVADDDERQPGAASASSRTPFSFDRRADVQDVRRVVRLADRRGNRDTARDHANVEGAERAGVLGERSRRAYDDSRATEEPTRERPHPLRESTSEPQS